MNAFITQTETKLKDDFITRYSIFDCCLAILISERLELVFGIQKCFRRISTVSFTISPKQQLPSIKPEQVVILRLPLHQQLDNC